MILVADVVALGVVGIAFAFVLESAAYHRRDQRIIGLGWGVFIASLALLVLTAAATWAVPP